MRAALSSARHLGRVRRRNTSEPPRQRRSRGIPLKKPPAPLCSPPNSQVRITWHAACILST
ncbi:hypothetical protein CLJ1_5424 [Pseudomonas paraeruginosa]|nr:hypothetical protein CLJ1_5424 [Pseudomonas aeruginosa]